MAFRTWAKLLAATLGVGALAGASQLGLAYGLGIVRLTRVLDVTTRDQWTAQLAWVAWVPMLAAVAGALAGAALLRRWAPGSPVPGVGTELALAFAAAIGAGLVVPLTMQPARTAQVAGVNAVVVIAICAGLGALIGVFAAWAALAQPIARWSLASMGAAVWMVALVSVAPSLAPSDPLPAIRLGVFDAGFLSPAVTQRTALATMPALALLIGALLGWLARRRELPILTVALAGLPGPALLTIAYLIAGPGAGEDRYQVVPYWAAMTATGAGVLGSVLAAVLRRGPAADDDEQDDSGPARPPRQQAGQPALAGATTGPGSPAGGLTGDGTTGSGTTGGGPAGGLLTGGILTDGGTTGGGTTGGGPAGGIDEAPRPADSGAFDLPQRARSKSGRRSRTSSAGPDAGLGGPGLGGPGPGLGGPAPSTPKSQKPRHGRRSSVADAFISRTNEFPTTHPGDPATRPGDPSGRPGDTAGRAGGGESSAAWPDGDTSEFPAARPGDSAATPPAGRHSGGGVPWSPAGDPLRPAGRAEPYVPEPATRPLPPGVGQAAPEPAQPRGTGGRGRGLRPFGRGKAAGPLTPEPTPISAPLPQPDPVTPPLTVTPALPKPAGEAPDGRRKTKGGKDEDYVDWVSGLGS